MTALPFLLKTLFAASILAFSTWLAGKRPDLAGLILSLPILSILAVATVYVEHKNLTIASDYAKSILLAFPMSALFFLPFFFAEKWHWNFWFTWGLGVALLVLGYYLHAFLYKLLA
ncbi:MAG: hypothetical protein L6Q57_05600 [Alphaproteobacteria bacterium]|nr:hypothetical protein [Alphaproteobacteria bacterium]